MKNSIQFLIVIALSFLSCSKNSSKTSSFQTKSPHKIYQIKQIILIYEDVPRKKEEDIRNFKATIDSSTIRVKVYNSQKIFHDTTLVPDHNFFTSMCKLIDSLQLEKNAEVFESGCDSGRNYKVRLFDKNHTILLDGYAYYCGKLAAGNLKGDPRPLFDKLKQVSGFIKLLQ
jgi:hypothetical protein